MSGSESELVLLSAFSQSFEANLAKACLEEAGIQAHVAGAEVSDMAWHLTNAIGGVKLFVQKSDLQTAQVILRERQPYNGDETDTDNLSDEISGSAAASEEESDRARTPREEDACRAFRATVLGLLFPPLQFYAFWLLIKTFLSDEDSLRRPQSSTYR